MYILLQFCLTTYLECYFLCYLSDWNWKTIREKMENKYNPPPSLPLITVASFAFLHFEFVYKSNKIPYLYQGVCSSKKTYQGVWKHIEIGFSQHRIASATQVNTKNTIIMERDIIDAHNMFFETLIGLHWCNTISWTLFFTMLHFDSLCKSGYISSRSWIDLL